MRPHARSGAERHKRPSRSAPSDRRSTAGQLQVTVPPETGPILVAGLNAAARSSPTDFPMTGDYQLTYLHTKGASAKEPTASFDLVSGMRSKGSLTRCTSHFIRL
jgi:hypothetical protein